VDGHKSEKKKGTRGVGERGNSVETGEKSAAGICHCSGGGKDD